MRTAPGVPRYRVVSGLVIAYTAHSAEYCYRYALIPTDTKLSQVEALLADGHIELVKEA